MFNVSVYNRSPHVGNRKKIYGKKHRSRSSSSRKIQCQFLTCIDLRGSSGGILLVHSSLAACANLHTAAFAHECEHLLSRHDTSMSSRTASTDTRQVDLLLVNVTSWFATEATLRLETDLQHAGPCLARNLI